MGCQRLVNMCTGVAVKIRIRKWKEKAYHISIHIRVEHNEIHIL